MAIWLQTESTGVSVEKGVHTADCRYVPGAEPIRRNTYVRSGGAESVSSTLRLWKHIPRRSRSAGDIDHSARRSFTISSSSSDIKRLHFDKNCACDEEKWAARSSSFPIT